MLRKFSLALMQKLSEWEESPLIHIYLYVCNEFLSLLNFREQLKEQLLYVKSIFYIKIVNFHKFFY